MSSPVPLRLTLEERNRQLREQAAQGLPSDQLRTQEGGTIGHAMPRVPGQAGTGEPVEKGQPGTEGLQKLVSLLSLGASAAGNCPTFSAS